jgi:hypothetical protein
MDVHKANSRKYSSTFNKLAKLRQSQPISNPTKPSISFSSNSSTPAKKAILPSASKFKTSSIKSKIIKHLCFKIISKNTHDTPIADETPNISTIKYIPIARMKDLSPFTRERTLTPCTSKKANHSQTKANMLNKSSILSYNSSFASDNDPINKEMLPSYIPYTTVPKLKQEYLKYNMLKKKYRKNKLLLYKSVSAKNIYSSNQYEQRLKRNSIIKVEGAQRIVNYMFNAETNHNRRKLSDDFR